MNNFIIFNGVILIAIIGYIIMICLFNLNAPSFMNPISNWLAKILENIFSEEDK